MSSYNDTTAALQATVTHALTSANNNAARIYSLPVRETLREPSFNVALTPITLDAPPELGDLFDGSDDSGATVSWLNGLVNDWANKYFPEINGCFRTQPEETLCAIIGGVKPFGVDATVFELVWHQARDRAYRTVNSEVATLAASFGSRGFSLPPGALVDAIASAERSGRDAILDVNRDQAMKDADIKVDLLKHALSLATQIKLGMMNVMADFYRLWATLPDKGIERAKAKAAAMSSFYSALSSYYNVEIAFQELTLKAAQTKAGIDVDVDRNRLAHESNSASISGALGQAVSSFANVAAQASQAGGTLSAEIQSL